MTYSSNIKHVKIHIAYLTSEVKCFVQLGNLQDKISISFWKLDGGWKGIVLVIPRNGGSDGEEIVMSAVPLVRL